MLLRLSFLALLLVASVKCDDSLDDLINDLFVKNPGAGGIPISPVPETSPVGPATSAGANQDHCDAGSECVPQYLCVNEEINTSGEGIIDIRFNDDNPCVDYLLKCCSIDGMKKVVGTPPPPPEQHTCGHRNKDGIGFRITGNKDSESEYGEFPWMVAVLKIESALDQLLNVYQCGGTLIHPKIVLTGAHCVQNKQPSQLKVRAGEWDTQTKNEIYPHQDRNVQEIIVHPEYYKGALYNDIALLILDTPVELGETVQTVCLPPQGAVFDGNRCFASGWGKDVFGKEGKYQVILKKIDLPIVPRDKCEKSLKTTRLGARFMLHKSFICAGGEKGKDTCKGDGGSPLVCPIAGTDGYFYQAGIVSWGVGCGENQIPGVYADVAGFRHWVDEAVTSRGFETKYYTH